MKVKRLTNEELYHYGIKGQRRGVRRFQNEDGSLTYAGKQRYLSPSKGTYTHDGTNIKRDPNSFRPTLSYHSTAVNSTGYEARKNAERKKAELDQRTEDKKRRSIDTSREYAERRKLYDDHIGPYTAARKKAERDTNESERQHQEWKKDQQRKRSLKRQELASEKNRSAYQQAMNAKSAQEKSSVDNNPDYVDEWEKPNSQIGKPGSYFINGRNGKGEFESVKDRSDYYKQEAASIKERSEKRQAEAKKFTSKLKLFGQSFKEVHSENINKGKSKVQSILAKLKR